MHSKGMTNLQNCALIQVLIDKQTLSAIVQS